MPERLESLPQMQAKIDALLDAYGPEAVPTYSTDGTTCIILSGPAGDDDTVYLAVVQIDLETFEVDVREVTVEPRGMHPILI